MQNFVLYVFTHNYKTITFTHDHRTYYQVLGLLSNVPQKTLINPVNTGLLYL